MPTSLCCWTPESCTPTRIQAQNPYQTLGDPTPYELLLLVPYHINILQPSSQSARHAILPCHALYPITLPYSTPPYFISMYSYCNMQSPSCRTQILYQPSNPLHYCTLSFLLLLHSLSYPLPICPFHANAPPLHTLLPYTHSILTMRYSYPNEPATQLIP